MTPTEINALAAEKVMGWEVLPSNQHGCWVKENEHHVRTFDPSTDIRDAMGLLDAIHRMGFPVLNSFVGELGRLMPQPGGHNIDPKWWVFSMTPERLTLAALRAVGVEVPNA